MRRMDKLSENKAFALFSVTRRRTEVRRVAKFVHSIKHNYSFTFGFLLLLIPFIVVAGILLPFVYRVLCALHIFNSPSAPQMSYFMSLSAPPSANRRKMDD